MEMWLFSYHIAGDLETNFYDLIISAPNRIAAYVEFEDFCRNMDLEIDEIFCSRYEER